MPAISASFGVYSGRGVRLPSCAMVLNQCSLNSFLNVDRYLTKHSFHWWRATQARWSSLSSELRASSDTTQRDAPDGASCLRDELSSRASRRCMTMNSVPSPRWAPLLLLGRIIDGTVGANHIGTRHQSKPDRDAPAASQVHRTEGGVSQKEVREHRHRDGQAQAARRNQRRSQQHGPRLRRAGSATRDYGTGAAQQPAVTHPEDL